MKAILIYLIPVILVSIIVYIFLISGDGFYRYPCQDPENWKLPECSKPICLADGTCTEYLVKGLKNE